MELPPPVELNPEAPRKPGMSLFARLSNVIAAPGETFDDVKASGPSMANWLVPMLALMLVGWLGVAVTFSNPVIKQQLSEMTEKAMQQQFAGKNLPQQQIDAAKEMAATIQRVAQLVGLPLGVAIWTFASGLVIWLVGRFAFKSRFPFMKAVEAAGLCNVIVLLGQVVRILLVMVMQNMFAAPSLMLLIKNFDPQNTLHAALSTVEVFTLWTLGVVSVALARLSGASTTKAAAWVFGIWIAVMGGLFGFIALMKAVFAQFMPH